jgi:hypothetical protein
MKLSRPLRLFLLHARSDERAVRRLYQRLSKTGADVWLDQKKLLPGQDWACEIHKAIYTSDIVIACLSKRFNEQGGYRHEELRIVLKRAASLKQDRIFIIPARLEACDLPEALRRWQRVDLFETEGYTQLLRALYDALV